MLVGTSHRRLDVTPSEQKQLTVVFGQHFPFHVFEPYGVNRVSNYFYPFLDIYAPNENLVMPFKPAKIIDLARPIKSKL